MHNSRVEHVGKLWAPLLCHASAMREGHSVPVAMVETCTDSAADGATDADSDGETYSAYVDYTCRDAAIDLATVTRTSPQPTTVTAAPSAATTVTPPAAAGAATNTRSTPYYSNPTAPSRSGCRTTTTTAGTRRAGAELARARTSCSVLVTYVSSPTIPTFDSRCNAHLDQRPEHHPDCLLYGRCIQFRKWRLQPGVEHHWPERRGVPAASNCSAQDDADFSATESCCDCACGGGVAV